MGYRKERPGQWRGLGGMSRGVRGAIEIVMGGRRVRQRASWGVVGLDAED